ncbi:MAG: BtpA/SgcQ family protein [Alphaproteobacteria bacterium]
MTAKTFPFRDKTIVGMAHLPPLPGAPFYDRDGGMAKILDVVAADIEALQGGGIDAIMFGNEGDRPYTTGAPIESVTAMAAVIGEVKALLKVPFGTNYLWNPKATVALGIATGASFGREIMTGAYASDMGFWVPDAMAAMRLRAEMGRNDFAIIFNINAEFASPLDTRPIAIRAKSAVFSAAADIIAVSGPMTGQGVDSSELAAVKEALPDTPVFANTGVRAETVGDILKVADGCVVGTALKVGGDTWNPVDRERVARFMDVVGKAR